MENKGDFNPRRIASENFRGFSFIQKDFLLPERDQAEIEKYWNSAEEDGESDSDNASSKFGQEPPPPAEPEKKKRPARKRKKKNKGADVKTPPTNSVAPSVASSESSIPDDSEEARDAITKKVPELLAPTDTTTNKQVTIPALHVAESVAIPNTSTNIMASPQSPKQPREDVAWQAAKSTPDDKKKAKPLQSKPQHQPYSLDRSKNQKYAPPMVQRQPVGTPGYMKQQQQRFPPKSEGWAGSNLQHYQHKPTQNATGGWQVAHHHNYPQQGQGLARQPKPVLQSTPKGPPPGSWAAKLQGIKTPSSAGPVQTRQQVPQSSRSDESVVSEVPPHPSSDWRQHTMSPSSKKAMISEPKLMGAWAARNK